MARFRRVLQSAGKTSMPRAKMRAAIRPVLENQELALGLSEKGVLALKGMDFPLKTSVEVRPPKGSKNAAILIIDGNGDYTTARASVPKAGVTRVSVDTSGRVTFIGKRVASTGRVAVKANLGKIFKREGGMASGLDSGFTRRR